MTSGSEVAGMDLGLDEGLGRRAAGVVGVTISAGTISPTEVSTCEFDRLVEIIDLQGVADVLLQRGHQVAAGECRSRRP